MTVIKYVLYSVKDLISVLLAHFCFPKEVGHIPFMYDGPLRFCSHNSAIILVSFRITNPRLSLVLIFPRSKALNSRSSVSNPLKVNYFTLTSISSKWVIENYLMNQQISLKETSEVSPITSSNHSKN